VNERDELGSDLVPDFMTSVRDAPFLRVALQLLRASTSIPAFDPPRAGPGVAESDRPGLRGWGRIPHRWGLGPPRRATSLPGAIQETACS